MNGKEHMAYLTRTVWTRAAKYNQIFLSFLASQQADLLFRYHRNTRVIVMSPGCSQHCIIHLNSEYVTHRRGVQQNILSAHLTPFTVLRSVNWLKRAWL